MPVRADGGDADVKISAIKVWQFSKCTIARDKRLVEKLLASKQNSSDYKTMFGKLTEKNGSCIGAGNLKMSGGIARNALAAAYLEDRFRDQPLPDFSSVPPLYRISSLPSGTENKQIMRMGVHQFVECVARSAPEQTVDLFATDPFSAAESEVFETLQPVMGSCLPVEAGVKLGFTRLELRTLLGKITYRLLAASENRTGAEED